MHDKMILRASFLFENFFTKTDILEDALFNALKRFFFKCLHNSISNLLSEFNKPQYKTIDATLHNIQYTLGHFRVKV